MYDLVIEGGAVSNPFQGLHAPQDVVLTLGKVVLEERRLVPVNLIRNGQMYAKGPRLQRKFQI